MVRPLRGVRVGPLLVRQAEAALRFIQPEKPVQNAFIESFNGKLRDECLNEHWFTTIWDALER